MLMDSSQLSILFLLTIALAPLVGAAIAGLLGKQIGRTGAHAVTIIGVGVSCALSCQVLYQLYTGQADPFNQNIYTFYEVGPGVLFANRFLVQAPKRHFCESQSLPGQSRWRFWFPAWYRCNLVCLRNARLCRCFFEIRQ